MGMRSSGARYSVQTIPFDDRATNHLSHQPSGQMPYLDDGELKIFESGAIMRRNTPI